MIVFLVIGVLLFVTLWMFNLQFGHTRRMMRKIPGPKLTPIIGNTLEIMLPPDQLFKYLRSLKQYGDLVRLVALDVHVVNVYGAENAEKLLSNTKYNEKRSPYNFLEAWLGKGLLISNGEKWQHRRKLLTPAFHFNILKQYSKTFNDVMEDFIDKIKKETGKEKTDPAPLIAETTLQVMCETAMGTSMNQNIKDDTKKYLEGIQVLGQVVFTRMSRIVFHKEWIYQFSSTKRTQKAALFHLHKFTNQVINERKAFLKETGLSDNKIDGKKSRLAMLDLLINNEIEGKINHNGIREEVDTFMFEGHDTTAVALSFMIMRIANEAKVQENIFEEMHRIFGDSDRMPTTNDLADMKYLEMCIKESLRLYPSVPLIARYLNQDTELSGYIVPAGTICQIHIFDIHRQKDLYPEPERFIPERFSSEEQNKRNLYSFLSFSAGPRNCIGQKFAMLELKTVMSTLLRNFVLEPVTTPEQIEYIVDIVLRPSKPFYVKFRSRK